MMVWQSPERNEWDVAIQQCMAAAMRPVVSGSGGPNAFSLSDPAAVQAILQAAGFCGVTFTDVDEPVYYGPDVDPLSTGSAASGLSANS